MLYFIINIEIGNPTKDCKLVIMHLQNADSVVQKQVWLGWVPGPSCLCCRRITLSRSSEIFLLLLHPAWNKSAQALMVTWWTLYCSVMVAQIETDLFLDLQIVPDDFLVRGLFPTVLKWKEKRSTGMSPPPESKDNEVVDTWIHKLIINFKIWCSSKLTP